MDILGLSLPYMLYLIVKTNLRPFMPIREFLNNLKHKFLTQSVPGSYKKPLSAKTCLFFLLLGLLNIVLGIITLNIYKNLLVLTLPYGLGTQNQSFTIPKQTKAPLYVYLQIDDFYQSHLFYAKSYSSKQLKGDATDKIGTCKPLKYADGKIIYPCGLMANTFNQDAFRIVKNGRDVPINDKDIAWSSSQKRIKNTKYNLDQITAPPDWEPYNEVPRLEGNERFANWMSQSSFANFRKLYGKIDNGLSEGDYELVTNSKFPYGRLSLVLAESSWAGGKNYFLSVLMIVCGSILVLGSALLFMKSNTFEA